MKKIFILAAFALCLAACGNKNAGNSDSTVDSTEVAVVADNVPVYSLDSLLAVADQLVNKTVTVKGSVTHTCKHSGKRCFIVGDHENVTMRVEAKGNIGGFNRELVGSELAITGVVKERRLTKEYIDNYEKEVNEKKVQEDGSAETCQAELANINEMRDWMKKNHKDYYALYYMDGEEYNVIGQ
ncbi:hypothetical protein [Parabacteroides sp. Marseille-P3160]|uniref:hypothetical protein n=1 Tax=Parabacteroides sp. Marseille-P3160 TaxID=1917887 RepID=UPI0009BAB90D|nr:hypothetical protein [Parabacteroides sp. Marseille-P3160]